VFTFHCHLLHTTLSCLSQADSSRDHNTHGGHCCNHHPHGSVAVSVIGGVVVSMQALSSWQSFTQGHCHCGHSHPSHLRPWLSSLHHPSHHCVVHITTNSDAAAVLPPSQLMWSKVGLCIAALGLSWLGLCATDQELWTWKVGGQGCSGEARRVC
jgi:hypothetical protein